MSGKIVCHYKAKPTAKKRNGHEKPQKTRTYGPRTIKGYRAR